MRKQVRRLSAVFDDCEELNKNTNGFFFPSLWRDGRFAAVHQQPHYLQMSNFHVARGHTYSSWDVSGCWNVPISQDNENKMSSGVDSQLKRRMVFGGGGAGGEGTGRDWVGKARERIGMAVGRVPNAHSEGQSLEPLCAGNTKRLAPRSADNGLMGVLRQLNFQRARGERCPSLSALSNRPKWHKDTLWTWQKLSHPCFHRDLEFNPLPAGGGSRVRLPNLFLFCRPDKTSSELF